MLQVLRKYYAGGILGHDKEGAVVKLELLGKLDMKGLMRSTRRTDLERYDGSTISQKVEGDNPKVENVPSSYLNSVYKNC